MASRDVQGCVFSIVTAFTSGLDVLRKLREKRRQKKSRTKSDKEKELRRMGDELELHNSLSRGPIDISREYERSVVYSGGQFARGDAIAHSALTNTVLKLNSGLVSIISSFLSAGKNELQLDYKSLTNLSDASRLEALLALSQLSDRITRSQLLLQQQPPPTPGCPRCGSTKHENCGRTAKSTGSKERSQSEGKPRRKKKPSSSGGTKEVMVTRIPLETSGKPELALVRPRKGRTTSSSSSSSSSRNQSNASTALTTPDSSPASSPTQLPLYTFPHTLDRPPSYNSLTPRASPAPQAQSKPRLPARRTNSDTQVPQQPPRPNQHHYERAYPSASPLPTVRPPPRAPSAPTIPPKPAALRPIQTTVTPPTPILQEPIVHVASGPLAIPRRLDKPTPSTYTFASVSTKLGEIPMHKWNQPYDFATAKILNEEAKMGRSGWPLPPPPEKKRGGFLGFLRATRGGA